MSGAVLTSKYIVEMASGRRILASSLLLSLAAVAGCGSQYRPVVTSINPVGPAGQPTKYAVAISANGATTNGLVTIVDFAGDTILDTTAIGANPKYLMLESSGSEGYTLNGDGTVNSFAISTSLRANDVLQSTLLANSNPVSILAQGTYLYIAQGGRNSVAELQGLPPAIKQELPTGTGTIYTVGVANAPRVYAIAQGATAGSTGTVSAIDTTTNTVTNTIAVGQTPVYGVMTASASRAFILNNASNTVSVVNAQTNALDTFTRNGVVTGTIPVGQAPVWADLAPTLNELVVANQGGGTAATPGSVSIIGIPFCSGTTLTTNPNCDPANPLDAVGFGTVLATIPVGVNPVMVAVLQDGTRAYVANAGNAALGIAGSISVINLTNNTVSATLPAGTSSVASDSLVHGHPTFIAVTTGTPTGKAYVTSSDSTDLTIIRTDTDSVLTHLSLQGMGVQVRVTQP